MIPGANDNASAVAVMMGVAKALTEHNIKLKRSVLFLSFGAEEQGIIGSKAYLENPVFPLDKSILLNMDGVGIAHRSPLIAHRSSLIAHRPSPLPAHIIYKYLIGMPDIKSFSANHRMCPVHTGPA